MKKLLVLMITLCLLMSVCPVGMAVSAHRHYACGVVDCPDHSYWSSREYMPLPAGGSLTVDGYTAVHFLTQNTSLDALNVINDGKLYLCLNGYTLYHDGITLQRDYSEVYLCDCKGGGKVMPKPGSNAGIDVNSGCLYLYSGTITGHTNTAIRLGRNDEDARGIFEMLGGEISGNSGVNGGGISCDAAMCTLYLQGGVIKNNTASRGGGFYLSRGNHEIYMTEISGNSAVNGGGGYLALHDTESFCQIVITRANITGNRTTGGMGGGIYAMNGARISIGSSTVYNNTSNGKACNMHFTKGYFDKNEEGWWKPLENMSVNEKIGISVEDTVTPDSPLRFLTQFDSSLGERSLSAYVSDQGYSLRLVAVNEDANVGELYVPRVPAPPVPAPTPTPVPAPPATGDNTPVLLWAAMLLIAAGAAVLLRRKMAK